jgi:YesN/AraC family two-component response regulator
MKIFIRNIFLPHIEASILRVFTDLALPYQVTETGELEVLDRVSALQFNALLIALHQAKLEVLHGKKAILTEQIRYQIHMYIHDVAERTKVKLSQHLSLKLHYNYTYLASLFSTLTGITIEQYAISYKLECVKDWLRQSKMSLTEIAEKLQYSSVAHLSGQFRKINGYSPSAYKRMNHFINSKPYFITSPTFLNKPPIKIWN